MTDAAVVRIDTNQLRLVLKMPRLFGFRIWITMRLLQLAGLVSPVTIEISHVGD